MAEYAFGGGLICRSAAIAQKVISVVRLHGVMLLIRMPLLPLKFYQFISTLDVRAYLFAVVAWGCCARSPTRRTAGWLSPQQLQREMSFRLEESWQVEV